MLVFVSLFRQYFTKEFYSDHMTNVLLRDHLYSGLEKDEAKKFQKKAHVEEEIGGKEMAREIITAEF